MQSSDDGCSHGSRPRAIMCFAYAAVASTVRYFYADGCEFHSHFHCFGFVISVSG